MEGGCQCKYRHSIGGWGEGLSVCVLGGGGPVEGPGHGLY